MKNTQRWKVLKPGSKFKLHGQYMEKNSSRSTRVEFVFNDGILSVFEIVPNGLLDPAWCNAVK